MNFKNIMVAVKQNAIHLTNKEFVQFIVTELSKSFMLKDSKGNMPVLSDSRVSEWISDDRLPPSLKTIFSLSDFPETLSYLADDFFYDFSEKINGEKLSKELKIVFESNHEFEKGKCSCDDKLAESLFYCLYDFFEKQYKQYEVSLSNAKKLPKSSLFCKIIRELVRQGDKPVYEKHEIPYDLKDKIQKNHIDGNMRVMIEENFDDNYEIIENTLNILSEEEVSSRQSFLKVMRDYYFEYLNEHHISFDDEEKVQEKAIDIFNWVKAKVCSKVECSEDESCCDEEVPVYAFSLVAYAFYKCRILLKVDGEK